MIRTCVVQSSQDPKLVHGVEHVVLRWWVHEVEQEQILDAQRLQQQDYVGQVGPLDLWYGGRQHLIFIGALSVQPETETDSVSVNATPPGMALYRY